MSQSDPSPAGQDPVPEALVRIQQMLLAAGYQYAEGNPETWPICPVRMWRGADRLYVVPWDGDRAEAFIEFWEAARRQEPTSPGLLAVGAEDVEAPAVRALFEHTGGTLAYLDAEGRQFRLRRSWSRPGDELRPLTRHNLRKLLDPAAGRKSRRIDCLPRLRRHLEQVQQEQEFLDRTAGLSGQSPPLTTLAIVGLCLAVFAAMVLGSRQGRTLWGPSEQVMLAWGALYGPYVAAGQWWRIITCGLVHLGLFHLLLNLFALYVFGSALESLQGRWRMAMFFAFSVVAGSLARLWWGPYVISAGASGGIFGLIGALLAVVIRYRRDFPASLSRRYGKWLGTVLLLNAVYLVSPHIDSAAHVGGLLGGFIIALVLARSPVQVRWPSVWAWLALAGLVVGACAFGQYAVGRIRPEDPRAMRAAPPPPSGGWPRPTRQVPSAVARMTAAPLDFSGGARLGM